MKLNSFFLILIVMQKFIQQTQHIPGHVLTLLASFLPVVSQREAGQRPGFTGGWKGRLELWHRTRPVPPWHQCTLAPWHHGRHPIQHQTPPLSFLLAFPICHVFQLSFNLTAGQGCVVLGSIDISHFHSYFL